MLPYRFRVAVVNTIHTGCYNPPSMTGNPSCEFLIVTKHIDTGNIWISEAKPRECSGRETRAPDALQPALTMFGVPLRHAIGVR
jgi:hypothetical protein